jgi:acyl carrier protein
MASMSRDDILREIQRIMKELFKLTEDRVVPEARLGEDLELDSLDALDFAVKVEVLTGKAFSEKQLRAMRTIEDVIVALLALAPQKREASA